MITMIENLSNIMTILFLGGSIFYASAKVIQSIWQRVAPRVTGPIVFVVPMLITLALVALLALRASSIVDEISKKTIDEINKRTIDFGTNERVQSNEIHKAKTAGIVSASATVKANSTGRVLLYGYVSSDRGKLVNNNPNNRAKTLARAGMQYSDEKTNLPILSLTMPVRKGQYWTVRESGGRGNYDVEVFFTSIKYARER